MIRHNLKPQWPANASRQLVCGMVLGLACALAGCGPGPKAEFQYRDSTLRLIPKAQEALTETLKEGFGTPHELVAWERFPIDYGGVRGRVSSPAKVVKPAAGTVTVVFEGDASQVKAGSPLLWLSGARVAEGEGDAKPAKKKSSRKKAEGSQAAVGTVVAYDAKTNELQWSGPAEPAPAPGDRLVIGFGEALQQGRKVYMKNCMHCHGVSGDGAGPTAEYLYPRPRDYRLGLFKFTSTLTPEKPSRDDLHRIVKYGIPGTYMPSFLLLGETETKAVVEYVRWLSVRGEFEKRTDDDLADFSQDAVDDAVKKAKKEDKLTPRQARDNATKAFKTFQEEDLEAALDGTAKFLADGWTRADDAASVIVPSVPRVTDDAASRARGRLLYMSDKTKCYTCHGMLGKGDGAATEDFWKKPGKEEFYSRRGLHDAWGHILQPRNLTLGQYRGGRRPVDVFRRIYAGIKGTPMPGFGKTALKDAEIWDIVNYAMSIQYQSSQPAKSNAGGHVAATEAPTAK